MFNRQYTRHKSRTESGTWWVTLRISSGGSTAVSRQTVPFFLYICRIAIWSKSLSPASWTTALEAPKGFSCFHAPSYLDQGPATVSQYFLKCESDYIPASCLQSLVHQGLHDLALACVCDFIHSFLFLVFCSLSHPWTCPALEHLWALSLVVIPKACLPKECWKDCFGVCLEYRECCSETQGRWWQRKSHWVTLSGDF